MGLFTCVFAWISSATKLLSKLLSGCYELSPEAANSSLIPVVAGADLEVAVLGVEDQSPKVRMKVVLSFFLKVCTTQLYQSSTLLCFACTMPYL